MSFQLKTQEYISAVLSVHVVWQTEADSTSNLPYSDV